VTIPLILLAIPSVVIGFFTIEPMLFGDFFSGVIFNNADTDPVAKLGVKFKELHGASGFATHALVTPAFWLMLGGVITAVNITSMTLMRKS